MGRISLFYISIILILTYFFLYMTVKYPNFHNQFDKDRFEKSKTLLLRTTSLKVVIRAES